MNFIKVKIFVIPVQLIVIFIMVARIDCFFIGRTLGEGNFGKVKEACKEDGIRYVLKILKHEGQYLEKRKTFR